MRISKHIITQMQKALVTYGINVPVTGEFDAKLQQAYVDWAGRNETQGCILYPITDNQVSAKLLALVPSDDSTESTTVVSDSDSQTQIDLAAQAEADARATQEAADLASQTEATAAAEEEVAAKEADARIKAENQALVESEAIAAKEADDPTKVANAETKSTDDTKSVTKKKAK